MRNLPGWVAGALGVGAIVGAFYLGGRANASGASAMWPAAAAEVATTTPVATTAPTAGPDVAAGFAVECEPGQRAVVTTAAGAASRVACVSDPRAAVMSRAQGADVNYVETAPAVSGIVRVADRPYAQPAVYTEPMEVYRPRARTAVYQSREAAAPRRTVKKSVAIIAGSTAAGAVMGGLVKGRKGAVVGGLLGGGAATVWDQVTRRQRDVR